MLQPDWPFQLNKRSGRPCKLDDRDRKTFIGHVEQFLNDNLKALGTPSKSNHTFSQPTVWNYLRGRGFLGLRLEKNPIYH